MTHNNDVCTTDYIFNCAIHLTFSNTFKRSLTLFHSERPKLYAILAFLRAIGLDTLTASYYSIAEFATLKMWLLKVGSCCSKCIVMLLIYFFLIVGKHFLQGNKYVSAKSTELKELH